MGLYNCMYQDGWNNDWPDRDSKLDPLKLFVWCSTNWAICNSPCVPGFWSTPFPWRGVDQKSLAWGMNYLVGVIEPVWLHIPQKKNYWRKSEEYKLTWSYFDQSQVRISELWAGITVWGVSGLLASHTLTVWSPVIKKIV